MNKKIISIGISLIILSIILSGCTHEEEKQQTITDIAIEYITLLSENNYQQAYSLFNEDMKNAISIEYLQEIWEFNVATYGELKEITTTRQSNFSSFDVVLVNTTFEHQYLIVFRVVFNDEKQIAGFWMDDINSLIEYRPPEYVSTTSFSEVNITIGTDPWRLPATLSIPNGSGPFPGVILIHGSGPNDRDETIGPNKPFKDLAWGLASQNISVLRYEKRTKVYAEKINTLSNFTVEDEVINDVFSAINALKNQSYASVDSIYLLGHSLGGMMIPKILAVNHTDITGAILLATPARPLEDLVFNQTQYLLSIDGDINETEQATLNDLNESVQKIKTLNFKDNKTILNAPASYWEYLDSYDQLDTAKTLDLPLFFLQGKRDYQVTYEDDFQIWNETFAENPKVTLQIYKSLNHLFIEGHGTPTNNEYLVEGHVDAQVIEDIGQWIRTLS